MTVPMYRRLPLEPRNGLFLIQAMTLCRFQDMMRGTTVEERNQPHAGGSKKAKNPLGIARASCGSGNQYIENTCLGPVSLTYLDKNEFVKHDPAAHVAQGDGSHDDQRANHEALRP